MTLDPVTRAACAEALASSTAETLREIASRAVLQGSQGANCSTRNDLNVLAALALAVAEMQERSEKRFAKYPDAKLVPHWFITPGDDLEFGGAGVESADSLPAALAHLIREGA